MPFFDKRSFTHGGGLGKFRLVSERNISWPHQQRSLGFCYEHRAVTHAAFLGIAITLFNFHEFEVFCEAR
jgi:hypothetical protein